MKAVAKATALLINVQETEWLADGYEHWKCETHGGEVTLSRHLATGIVFGHNLRSLGLDKLAAVKLLFAARRRLRKWGADAVQIHFEGGETTREFWIRKFESRKLYEIWEIDIPPRLRNGG